MSTNRLSYSVKPRPIDLSDYKLASRSDFYRPLYEYATGEPVAVPFVVVRGERQGPVLGISAAVHGNELNGIKIIHNLLADLDLSKLTGSIVCAPVVNVPGFDRGQRYFIDGLDLNSYFPGKSGGQPAEQYARHFVETFLPSLDYLVDIHTASDGRLNTLYVRADTQSEIVTELAKLASPQIILNSKGGDGTLRAAARRREIPAITLEAGNPNVIQGRMVCDGEIGLRNILIHLGMIDGEIQVTRTAVHCESSRWIRTTGGGLLSTDFKLGEVVEKKQLLAQAFDPFGNVRQSYHAPYKGIVIGKAEYPVSIPGTRFCHLGKLDS